MLSPRTRAQFALPMKFAADEKRLRDAFGLGLHGVLEIDAEARSVAEEFCEARRVLRGGDDQDVANPGQHQRGQRIVDHRLVVDRQQALADRMGDGIEARARASGEDDALILRRFAKSACRHFEISLTSTEYCLLIHWR